MSIEKEDADARLALVTAISVFAASGRSPARDIRIALDQALPIRLVEPAEGVAIGNPAIAGVSTC